MKHFRLPARLLCLLLLLVLLVALSACKKKADTAELPAVTKEPTVKPAPKALWPLTGLPLSDRALMNRQPLSVKIENMKSIRPQTGLNSADIVYETTVEGGITRFNCLFDSNVPDEVGPVRSARLSDLWVVPQYHGLLFYSGANSQVLDGLKQQNLTGMSVNSAGAIYYRVRGKSAPHNLFLALSKAYDKAAELNISTSGNVPNPGPAFGALSSEVATSAAGQGLDIPFSPISDVTWTWDAASGHYLRENDGSVHRDAADGAQVWADNVVVLWAVYTPQAMKDPAGNGTFDTTLGGEGKVAIFRDGLRIDGTWKADRSAPPTFTDASGKPIVLKPGRTWFEVPSTDTAITSH